MQKEQAEYFRSVLVTEWRGRSSEHEPWVNEAFTHGSVNMCDSGVNNNKLRQKEISAMTYDLKVLLLLSLLAGLSFIASLAMV